MFGCTSRRVTILEKDAKIAEMGAKIARQIDQIRSLKETKRSKQKDAEQSWRLVRLLIAFHRRGCDVCCSDTSHKLSDQCIAKITSGNQSDYATLIRLTH